MCQESCRPWGHYSGLDADVMLWTQLRQMLIFHLDTHVDTLRLGDPGVGHRGPRGAGVTGPSCTSWSGGFSEEVTFELILEA